jgi:hypothetical protein
MALRILLTVLLALLIQLHPVGSVCHAQGEAREGLNGSSIQTKHGYKLLLGATRSWPRLREANDEIHAIERELRTLAPDVKRFEDWGDVYTGTLGIGLQKRLDLSGWVMWPGVFFNYGSGPVRTSQSNLPTVPELFGGAPMGYSFKQTYTVYTVEFYNELELYRGQRAAFLVGGGVSYHRFESDTELDVTVDQVFTRSVRSTFDDDDIGLALQATVEIGLTERVGLDLTFRHSWARFKGDSAVRDVQTALPGTDVQNYTRRTVADITGPIIGLYLHYKF